MLYIIAVRQAANMDIKVPCCQKQKKQIFSYIEGTNMYFCFTYFDCKKTDFLFSEVQLVISSQLVVTQSELHHSYPICSYDTLIIALSKNINQSYDTQIHILLEAQPTWSKVSEKHEKKSFEMSQLHLLSAAKSKCAKSTSQWQILSDSFTFNL